MYGHNGKKNILSVKVQKLINKTQVQVLLSQFPLLLRVQSWSSLYCIDIVMTLLEWLGEWNFPRLVIHD